MLRAPLGIRNEVRAVTVSHSNFRGVAKSVAKVRNLVLSVSSVPLFLGAQCLVPGARS